MADRWAEDLPVDSDDETAALQRAIAMSLGREPPPPPAAKQKQKRQPVTVDLTQDDEGEDGNEVDLTREEDIETASESGDEASTHGLGLRGVHAVQPAADTGSAFVVPKEEESNGGEQGQKHLTSENPVPAPASGPMAMLGLDRAKMEEERLARIRKRKAAEEEGQGGQADNTAKRVKMNDENRRPDVGVGTAGKQSVPPTVVQPRQVSDAAAGGSSGAGTSMPARPAQQKKTIATLAALVEQQGETKQHPKDEHSNSNSNSLPFPKGVVKKTWCRGQPRLGDDVMLKEVLQKDELEMALISSFQWDQEWLYEQFDLRKTRLILVAMGGSEEENEALRASAPQDRMRFVFPPMNGPGNMHSKLQILKFRTYLRIVVPTGNFVPYDWGETGVMENMVFLIDLPLIEDGERQGENNKLTPFGEDLVYFLEKQTIPDSLVRSLRKYDFSATAGLGFVHSCAGGHAEDAWRKTGYCGLGRTIKQLGLSSDEPVEVDILTSSLGAMTYDFLQMIYGACQGDSGLQEYESRTAPKSKKTSSTADNTASVAQRLQKLRDHMRVYFPSEKTIDQSRGGRDNAGTIFLMSRWWDQTTFPKAVMRDCRSKRPGLLMHNKVFYVRRKQQQQPPPPPASSSSGPSSSASFSTIADHGWAYVGSANMSESAWGRLVKDKASNGPKITCRNWECGVVVPVPGDRRGRRHDDDGGSNMLAIFEGTVPVPMQTPGAPYIDSTSNSSSVAAQGRVLMKPWCQR